ncbi:MAG: hypothetical protein ACI4KF_09625 [Huintestinicola sp.]
MINVEEIKNSSPEERILCELIETDLMGVILDECCTEDELGMIINAVHLYNRACGGNIRIFSVGKHNNTPYIRKLMSGYAVTDNFEFFASSDSSSLLTRFLGSEAIITSDPESSCAGLAKEFYVPMLCLSGKNDPELKDKVLHISADASTICAGLMIIRERLYTDELSGHKRLV